MVGNQDGKGSRIYPKSLVRVKQMVAAEGSGRDRGVGFAVDTLGKQNEGQVGISWGKNGFLRENSKGGTGQSSGQGEEGQRGMWVVKERALGQT